VRKNEVTQVKVKKIILGEMASNCYVLQLSNANCVLFDIGDGAAVLQAYLTEHELQPQAIFLTHGHYDHIAGVEEIRSAYHIPVYIHAQDAAMLSDSDKNLATWLTTKPFQKVTAWKTVTDGDTFSFEDTEITVLHTPGHTKGSVCYRCDTLLFTGDTLFHLSRGRTDFPGGSDKEMLESFQKLRTLDDRYSVYPGHGEDSTLAFEKTHNLTFFA